jgi:hypothetical protein
MDRPGATVDQHQLNAGDRDQHQLNRGDPDQHQLNMGDPLAMSPEDMREIGYQTIDLIVDQLSDMSTPAMRRGSAAELGARIGAPVPEGGRRWHELLADLDENVLTFTSRLAHRGYFAFIPASSTVASRPARPRARPPQPQAHPSGPVLAPICATALRQCAPTGGSRP